MPDYPADQLRKVTDRLRHPRAPDTDINCPHGGLKPAHLPVVDDQDHVLGVITVDDSP
jgi:CBS domain-containing protein